MEETQTEQTKDKPAKDVVLIQARLTQQQHKMLNIIKANMQYKKLNEALTLVLDFYRDNHKETPDNNIPTPQVTSEVKQ